MAPEYLLSLTLSIIGALIVALSTVMVGMGAKMSKKLDDLDNKFDTMNIDMLKQLNHINNRVTIVEVRSKN